MAADFIPLLTAVMILGLDETTQPRYKVTITLDPRSPIAEKCPVRSQERHDAVRRGRLVSTDSSEESEIVVARAIGGSNDEKPIP